MDFHYYSIYLFSLSVFINPIFLLSLPASLYSRPGKNLPSTQPPLAYENHHIIARRPSIISTRTEKTSLLIKRDWRILRNLFIIQQLGNGWSLHFDSLNICRTNVDVAASELLDFYTQVLAAAMPTWSSQPPMMAHGAELGDLSIHFRSEAPIPWELMNSWLLGAIWQMRAMPGNAVVAGYKVALINVIGTAPIWVELILPWAGAAPAA